MRTLKAIVLIVGLLSLAFFSKPNWSDRIQKVGIQVQDLSPELKVIYARGGRLGLARKNKVALLKDENLNARLEIALRDFSFEKIIFDEFRMAFERFTPWEVIAESEFSKESPDFIFDVKVLNYGLVKSALDSQPKVIFLWQVEGKNPSREESVWVVKKKKVSSKRNLKKWMAQDADLLKGELRAHILFAVQDLMAKKNIRQK